MTTGPLQGVNVLEFSQIIAGPFCGMHLADMGARVTKFEPLEGEPWRVFVELLPKESRTFASLNRGKRGVAIDLSRPEAREVVHRLAKDADVVVINYRPGVAEELGIDYETLSAINPRLIYCENTAYGRYGPLATRGGYDLVVQAMTGLMAGEAKMQGDVPTYIYPAVADYATGIQMANAICAALYYRERTGKGQRIDCTLMGTAIAMQTSQFTWIRAFDEQVIPPMLEELKQARAEMRSFTEQVAVHNKYRPAALGNIYYRVYQTKDGFIAVGALSQSLRLKVLAATGLRDPRFKEDGSFEVNPPGWRRRGRSWWRRRRRSSGRRRRRSGRICWSSTGCRRGRCSSSRSCSTTRRRWRTACRWSWTTRCSGRTRWSGRRSRCRRRRWRRRGRARCWASTRTRCWRRPA